MKLTWFYESLTRGPRWAWLLLLMALAAALRSPQLAGRSLWLDEAIQAYISGMPTPWEVIRALVLDRHPPGYSLLLHGVIQLGKSELALRIPSFLAGLGSIPLAYAVGRLWVGTQAGLLCAVLATIAPAWIFYAREARPYATGIFLVLTFLASIAIFSHRRDTRSWLLLTLASILCVCWQYAAAVIVAFGMAAALVWMRGEGALTRRSLFRVLSSGAVAAAPLAVIGAFVLIPQLRRIGTGGDSLRPYFYSITSAGSALGFVLSQPIMLVRSLFIGSPLASTSSLILRMDCVAAALVSIGVIVSARSRGRGQALLVVALGPVVFFLLAAGIGLHPFGGIRHCLPLSPGIFLLFATGAVWFWRRMPVPAAIMHCALLGVMLGYGFPDTLSWHVHDLKKVLQAVKRLRQPGDGAYVYGQTSAAFRYYCGPDDPWPGAVHRSVQYVKEPGGELEVALAGSDRLWIIVSHATPEAVMNLKRHLKKSAALTSSIQFPGAFAILVEPKEKHPEAEVRSR